jgi:heat shock protein HslJ
MSSDFLDGVWIVARYRRDDDLVEPSATGQRPTVEIDGDRLSGTMGVNRLTGRLVDGVPGHPLAVTRMAGPPEAMRQEHRLLALIEETDHMEADSGGMRMSGDGLVLIEFQRPETV